MERRRVVRVPASSANLGPGYDVLAAALALHLEVEVVETGSFAVHTELPVPRDRTNLLVRAFERLHSADGLEFRMASSIPLSRGLGSSAAAVVAGLMAADHLFELDADLFSLAAEMEGHPDNVAAALHGGFVVCAGGMPVRFDAPAGLEAVVVTPYESVSTGDARAVLPAEVPLADAVFNTAHAALLILGLSRGEWDLVGRGLYDRLHQPRRAPGRRAPSSAGPAVLLWAHYEQTGSLLERVRGEVGGWAEVARATFEPHGADVRAL